MYDRYKCEHCGANLDPAEQCDCKQMDSLNVRVRNRNRENYREYQEERECQHCTN